MNLANGLSISGARRLLFLIQTEKEFLGNWAVLMTDTLWAFGSCDVRSSSKVRWKDSSEMRWFRFTFHGRPNVVGR